MEVSSQENTVKVRCAAGRHEGMKQTSTYIICLCCFCTTTFRSLLKSKVDFENTLAHGKKSGCLKATCPKISAALVRKATRSSHRTAASCERQLLIHFYVITTLDWTCCGFHSSADLLTFYETYFKVHENKNYGETFVKPLLYWLRLVSYSKAKSCQQNPPVVLCVSFFCCVYCEMLLITSEILNLQ